MVWPLYVALSLRTPKQAEPNITRTVDTALRRCDQGAGRDDQSAGDLVVAHPECDTAQHIKLPLRRRAASSVGYLRRVAVKQNWVTVKKNSPRSPSSRCSSAQALASWWVIPPCSATYCSSRGTSEPP